MARPNPYKTDPDLEIALHTIDQFGYWVQNADTKLTVLAAAVGVLVPTFGADLPSIAHAFHTASAAGGTVLAIALALTGAGVLATVLFLGRGLLPQLHGRDRLNRFAFPSVAKASIDELLTNDGPTDREDAWHQAKTLAEIADRKFRSFATALRFFAAALVLGVAAASTAATINANHTTTVTVVRH